MTLYTKDNCNRCDMIKDKLNSKGIPFNEVKDEEIIMSLGIDFLPVLEVEGELLDLGKANNYINSL